MTGRRYLGVLKASRQPGRTSKTHSKYESIRKIASAYGNHHEASISAAGDTWVMKSDFKIPTSQIVQLDPNFSLDSKRA